MSTQTSNEINAILERIKDDKNAEEQCQASLKDILEDNISSPMCMKELIKNYLDLKQEVVNLLESLGVILQ